MRWSILYPIGMFVAQACSTAAPVPVRLQAALAEMPEASPARLWLVDNRIVAAAVATGPGAIPGPARTTIEATFPDGDTVFQGREWGVRGEGFRVDKVYRMATQEHRCTVLVAAGGRVLERGHTVPIGEVPQSVLASAMTAGPTVIDAMIVSGPEVEECWRCQVTDRLGHDYVVTVSLDGSLRSVSRRVAAILEV